MGLQKAPIRCLICVRGMNESTFHMVLAPVFFFVGVLYVALPGRIIAWLCNSGCAGRLGNLFKLLIRLVPKSLSQIAERWYEHASPEKWVRGMGVVLIAGASLQLWASVMLKSGS